MLAKKDGMNGEKARKVRPTNEAFAFVSRQGVSVITSCIECSLCGRVLVILFFHMRTILLR